MGVCDLRIYDDEILFWDVHFLLLELERVTKRGFCPLGGGIPHWEKGKGPPSRRRCPIRRYVGKAHEKGE